MVAFNKASIFTASSSALAQTVTLSNNQTVNGYKTFVKGPTFTNQPYFQNPNNSSKMEMILTEGNINEIEENTRAKIIYELISVCLTNEEKQDIETVLKLNNDNYKTVLRSVFKILLEDKISTIDDK